MIENGGKNVIKILNRILKEKRIPSSSKESIAIILYKDDDDRTDLWNYIPGSILNVIYNLFRNVTANRLTTKYDGYQPTNQVG